MKTAGTARNGNLLCSVCIDTTGEYPLSNDLVNICILPLDRKFDMDKNYKPYVMTIRPIFDKPRDALLHGAEYKTTHRRRAKGGEYNQALTYGLSYVDSADLFDNWFASLGLKERKRIIPLAYDWAWVSGFLKKWLSAPTFEECFDFRYRDLLACISMENDNAEYNFRELPYRKLDYSYMGSVLGMPDGVLRLEIGERAMMQGTMYREYHHRRNTLR